MENHGYAVIRRAVCGVRLVSHASRAIMQVLQVVQALHFVALAKKFRAGGNPISGILQLAKTVEPAELTRPSRYPVESS